LIYGIIFFGLLFAWRRYDLKRQRLKKELELEHVEAEKLIELDSMKSRFFANISHEFRTPLTLILGPLQKLFARSYDEETKQELGIMQRNARRLQNLINQLLDLSKLESGKMELHARETDVIPLIKGYVQSFESLARQKGIDLIFNSGLETILLWTDQDKLEKILYNLLSNAFKFTPEGGRIEVRVYSLQLAEMRRFTANCQLSTANLDKGCIVISVTDTGPGISPENLPHIFDRFYQTADNYSKDGDGTGIGLALTKELVDLHHGMIEVESVVGEGSVFRVYLPLGHEHLASEEIDENRQLAVSNRQLAIGNNNLIEHHAPLTVPRDQKSDVPLILIVEDNSDLRLYIRSYLDQSYNVIEAEDGRKGVDRAFEDIPDMIISDVMMPVMDGYEFCKTVKTDERTSHIPVILLTARASTESKLEGLETGADDFITKPFDPQELLTRIKNLIELRKNLQERFMRNFRKLGLEHLMDLETPDMKSTDQNFMQKAIRLVLENIADPDLNVEKLSADLAVSRRQLHRKMVAITGDSPNRFIRTVRLNRAAELLKNKSGNVTEIAYEVGFNNLSYFAKSFKEEFGILPSEMV